MLGAVTVVHMCIRKELGELVGAEDVIQPHGGHVVGILVDSRRYSALQVSLLALITGSNVYKTAT
mgnify:CR=1 FL=1